MAIICKTIQNINNAGLGPQFRIFWKSKLFGNPVCNYKADTKNIHAEAIGVLLHKGNGSIVVSLVYFRGISGADTMGLQKQHDLTNLLLVFPGLLDQGDPFCPDPFDFFQTLYLVLDNIKGFFPEFFDDAVRHLGAQAFDHAGTQVSSNAVNGCRHGGSVGMNLELVTIFRVMHPFPFQVQNFSRGGRRDVSDNGNEVPLALHFQFGDRVAILLVGVGDAFNLTCQCDHFI